VLIWFFLGKPRGVYAFVIVLYGIAISVLNFTGITLVIASGHYAGWLFLAGSMLFIISDTMLCYSIIQREFPHARFFIMLTYITAQASLTAASLLPFYRP
ncbi:MAG: hypothetical protein IJ191_08890, partial [Treponema sp.]|nr:hypothetical protein [Treponema sp.]